MRNLFYTVACFATLTTSLPWIYKRAETSFVGFDEAIPGFPGIDLEFGPTDITIDPGSAAFTGEEIIIDATGGIEFSTEFGGNPGAVTSTIVTTTPVAITPPTITITITTTITAPFTNTTTPAVTTTTLSATATNTTTSSLASLSPSAVATGSAAVKNINDNDGIGAGADAYTIHTGNGSPASGYPSLDQ